MEKFVEEWLEKNSNWFKAYVIRNLDINTVKKWLKFNNQKICQCDKLTQISRYKDTDKKLEKSKSFNSLTKKNFIKLPAIENQSKVKIVNSKPILPKNLNRSQSFNLTIRNCSLTRRKRMVKAANIDYDNGKREFTRFYDRENCHVLKELSDQPSEPNNSLISINMVKRSNLIAMRKHNTMVSTYSQSLEKILKDQKMKLSLDIGNNNNHQQKKIQLSEKKLCPDLLIEMIKNISNELDMKVLTKKMVSNLKLITSANDVVIHFVARNSQNNKSESQNPTIFSYNDYQDTTFGRKINFLEDSFLVKKVVESGQMFKIEDIKKEKIANRFLSDVCPMTKSIVCLPIKNCLEQVIAVAQFHITDEIGLQGFGHKEIEFLNKYFPSCAASIAHAQLLDLYIGEYERNRALLEVVHDLFQQQTNLDTILFRIMQKAQTLLKCRRCSVLLIFDKDEILGRSDSRKAFDLIQNSSMPSNRKQSEIDDGTKISKNLANYVIQTGNTINLSDAYTDPRFDPIVDSVWKFKTQAILCMPIRNLKGDIIGCAQIANRLDRHTFDENDELLFEAFCIFCGLGINNTLIYNELEKSMAEKTVALEVTSYHAACSTRELDTFLSKHQDMLFNKNIQIDDFNSYVFDDFMLDSDEMVVASYNMFKSSGLMKTFQIDKKTMFLWLLTVRKNYRNVEYHNWRHAFNVFQSMYAIFKNSRISNYLEDIEKLILLVGCLCHDLDHRGTNNVFQAESQSALSQLYGTAATLEKHHFNHCIMILNTPGHNIFSQLKPKTYALVIKYIKEAILATDLADHFQMRKDFDSLTGKADTNWTDESACAFLRKNLMTACDLNAVTKPWNIHQNLVRLVTNEFFAQGDRERYELHIEPQEIMDVRRSHNMPKLQISWIQDVCMPLYKNFSNICESFNGHLVRIEDNRTHWVMLQKKASCTANLINKIVKE